MYDLRDVVSDVFFEKDLIFESRKFFENFAGRLIQNTINVTLCKKIY